MKFTNLSAFFMNALAVLLPLVATSVAANTVVEFYNTTLDHYFITADANEASGIDKGSAGPGWIRTGNAFFSGGTTPVCRFYGSQTPGPNSHFYTADAGECSYWKQQQTLTPATQKRWNFESLDFASTPAPANGVCPASTVPVYRAYNNGWSRGVDSNHRIATSVAAIQEVVSRGWSYEGVVMCAPVTPPCAAPQVWTPGVNACVYPMGVIVGNVGQLPQGCNTWKDQCWRDSVANGTVKFIATTAKMTGYSDRSVVFAYFRNTSTAWGVTGLWNYLPFYVDDGSIFGSDLSGGSSAEVDWEYGTPNGVILHDKATGLCSELSWIVSERLWATNGAVTCP